MPKNCWRRLCLLTAVAATVLVNTTSASADLITLHRQVLLTEVCPLPPFDNNPNCTPIHELVPLTITYDPLDVSSNEVPGGWSANGEFFLEAGIEPASNPFGSPQSNSGHGVFHFVNGFADYQAETFHTFVEEVCVLGDPCEQTEQHMWETYARISNSGVPYPLTTVPTAADIDALLRHGQFYFHTFSAVTSAEEGTIFGPDSRFYNGVIVPEPPPIALVAVAMTAFRAWRRRRTSTLD